jgi:hypothetical protein
MQAVAFPGSILTNAPSYPEQANESPSAANSPVGTNINVPEFNVYHCSAVTVNSEHDPQLLHPDMRGLEHYGHAQGAPRDAHDLVTESTEFPLPVAVKSLRVLSHHAYSPMGAALSCEPPPFVAVAVVVNSCCNSHSCNTYHPAERRLSAVIPRDAAGTLHEMGPCGPSSSNPPHLEAWDQKGNPLMILVTIIMMSTMGRGTLPDP